MAPVPTLVPLPPQRSGPVPLTTSPFWLGSRGDAAYPLFLPGVAERHVAIVERADGYWIIPGSGRATVNGSEIGSGVVLQQGDVIVLASDGIKSGFSSALDLSLPPGDLAEHVATAFGKGSDDALVLVARYLGGDA